MKLSELSIADLRAIAERTYDRISNLPPADGKRDELILKMTIFTDEIDRRVDEFESNQTP